MNYLKILKTVFIFLFFTVVTQIGGIPYLLNKLLYRHYISQAKSKVFLYKFLGFVIIYSIFTFILIPALAKPFGRVALPITAKQNVKPLTLMTCLLNRHYVSPELQQILFETASEVSKKYPNSVLNYLDANFPFIDNFPLLPHLSHNDGKKLDLSFCYKDALTNLSTNAAPSFMGYGICEEPTNSEVNTSDVCTEKGNWHYSFMRNIMPQGNKKNFIFDAEKTKFVINSFCSNALISKIFIEPHLKNRMGLTSEKVRFHGCQAVRHDDHIHIEIK